jgi:hypothetical protein
MFDKKNIMKIDFIKSFGNYNIAMVALYNQKNISESDVIKAIEHHGVTENNNVVIMTKVQFENVFLNAKTLPCLS